MRRWEARDLEPFAAINADPEVMEHFPALLSRAESAALIESIEAGFEEEGFGLWALQPHGEEEIIGFTGLKSVPPEMPFSPAIEVGWRLARSHWGKGLATEAARAAVEFGFGELGLDEIVAFTTRGNRRSRAVMERLGMQRDPAGDFRHPLIDPDSPLSEHVLYRLRAG